MNYEVALEKQSTGSDLRTAKRNSGLFSFFKWFKYPATSKESVNSDTLTSSSTSGSVESVDSSYSTGTVASFSFVPPDAYRNHVTEKCIALGPETDTYKARLKQREKIREKDKNITLRKKYNLFFNRDTLLKPALAAEEDNSKSLPLMTKKTIDKEPERLHRRTASESSKIRKAGAYCHVKGKRKAPQPPNKTDTLSLRRKKRTAPVPPLENIQKYETMEYGDVNVICNDSLKLDHGILKPAKEEQLQVDTSSPNSARSSYIEPPVSPRPWYKRNVASGTKKDKHELQKLPDLQYSRNNTDLNLEETKIEKKKEDKRKSGISFLANISELDREAAEVVKKDKEVITEMPVFMRPKTEQANPDTLNSPKRKSAKDLIAKFNAITNVTKVTVNPFQRDKRDYFGGKQTKVQEVKKTINKTQNENVLNPLMKSESASVLKSNPDIKDTVKPDKKSWYCPKCYLENDYWRIICHVCSTIKPYFDNLSVPTTRNTNNLKENKDELKLISETKSQSKPKELLERNLERSKTQIGFSVITRFSDQKDKKIDKAVSIEQKDKEGPESKKEEREKLIKMLIEMKNSLPKRKMHSNKDNKRTSIIEEGLEALENETKSKALTIEENKIIENNMNEKLVTNQHEYLMKTKEEIKKASGRLNIISTGIEKQKLTKNVEIKNTSDMVIPQTNLKNYTRSKEQSPQKQSDNKECMKYNVKEQSPQKNSKGDVSQKQENSKISEEQSPHKQIGNKLLKGNSKEQSPTKQKIENKNVVRSNLKENTPKIEDKRNKVTEINATSITQNIPTDNLNHIPIIKTNLVPDKANDKPIIVKEQMKERPIKETETKFPENNQKEKEILLITQKTIYENIKVNNKEPQKPAKVSTSAQTSAIVRKAPSVTGAIKRDGNFELIKPKDFASIYSEKMGNPTADHLYANWGDQNNDVALFVNIPRQISDIKNGFDFIQAQNNTDTLEINRLLRRLETAIAKGELTDAAVFARELAQLKVNCSVIRQKNDKMDQKKGAQFTINMFVEDRLSHRGPFPIPVTAEQTVGELRKQVEKDFEIPVNVQRWILDKELATDDKITLKDHHITSGCPVFLYLVAPTKDSKLSNEKLKESEKVGKITYDIQDKVEISHVKQQILAKPLETDKIEIEIEKTENIKEDYNIAIPSTSEDLKKADVLQESISVVVTKSKKIIDASVYPKSSNFDEDIDDYDCKTLKPRTADWECRMCTLLNPQTSNICAVCATIRQKEPIEAPKAVKRKAPQPKEKTGQKALHLQLLDLDNGDLVGNNEAFECMVCLMEIGDGEGVTLRECLHQFCKQCLAYTVEFTDDAEIKCPYRDYQYSCDIALQDREIKALVTPNIYEQYLARSVTQVENKIEKSFHCKTPDCKGWCIFEDNVNDFRCPVCRNLNCLTCQIIHTGMNCKQYQEKMNAESEVDEDAKRTRQMLEEMVNKGEALACPACQVILMKKWGCDWVRCSMCKTEICWVTKGPRWGPAGKGDTSGGCKCGVNGIKCHAQCNYCH